MRRRRQALGLQVEQVAQTLGTDATSVANWEHGRTAPALRFLPRLIAFLGYDPRPEPTTLGERLRHHRQGLGLTQRALAKALGVDQGTLHNQEWGRRRATDRILWRIQSYLDTNPDTASWDSRKSSQASRDRTYGP